MRAEQDPSWQQIWHSPAKINLFLHVVGRRPDGYHLLQTVFRLLDFGDTLTFAPDQSLRLTYNLSGVSPESDLCWRAAKLLQRSAGITDGVAISLNKRIPMGGGLGGGSSNAATVLRALNHYWQLNLSLSKLQQLGLQLGADVPVFILGKHAWAEGVGEQLYPVDLPEAWYLIAKPPDHVSTVEIFTADDLVRNTPRISRENWQAIYGITGTSPAIAQKKGEFMQLNNDLQPVVCRRYPAIAMLIERLSAFGEAKMSGSGACCFVEMANEAAARQALQQLQQQDPEILAWVTKSPSSSQLGQLQ